MSAKRLNMSTHCDNSELVTVYSEKGGHVP